MRKLLLFSRLWESLFLITAVALGVVKGNFVSLIFSITKFSSAFANKWKFRVLIKSWNNQTSNGSSFSTSFESLHLATRKFFLKFSNDKNLDKKWWKNSFQNGKSTFINQGRLFGGSHWRVVIDCFRVQHKHETLIKVWRLCGNFIDKDDHNGFEWKHTVIVSC